MRKCLALVAVLFCYSLVEAEMRIAVPYPTIREADLSPSTRAAIIEFPSGSLSVNVSTIAHSTITVNFSGSALGSGSSNYIQNRSTLQSGATFFVSSGTVNGVSFFDSTITAHRADLTELFVSTIYGKSPVVVFGTFNVINDIQLRGVSVSTISFWSLSSDAKDISNLNPRNVVLSSGLVVGTTIFISNVVAFSSVPVFHAFGYNSTLGSGTVFSSFVPDSPIALRRITATIIVPSALGSGDRWFCGDGTNEISILSPNAAVAGTRFSSKDYKEINAGTTVYMRMASGAVTTPTANCQCEYTMR